MSTFTPVLLKRAFYACCLSKSYWHLDIVTVLAVDPFAIFKLLLFSSNVHFSFIFNLVSRPYASSLGCVVISTFFLG